MTKQQIQFRQDLFVALIANPERYKYIAALGLGGMNNEELTQKNIRKAFKLAHQFEKSFEIINPIDP
jgi:hypothetical protein